MARLDTMGVRLGAEERARLDALCAASGRTRSNLVRWLIARAALGNVTVTTETRTRVDVALLPEAATEAGGPE